MEKQDSSSAAVEERHETVAVAAGLPPGVKGHVVVGRYLMDCLKKKKQGDETDYQWIMSQLKAKDMTEVMMTRWLTVFSKYITAIDDELIVRAVLNFSWAQCSEPVIELYIEYLSDLTSVYPHLISTVLHSLVTAAIKPDHVSESIYINIHRAIKTQLYLIPKAPNCLLKILETVAPYKGRDPKYQEVYIRCCLYIAQYYTNLSSDILNLIVLKMLQIDVEVPPLQEDDSKSEVETEQFPVDMDTDCTLNMTCSGDSLRDEECLRPYFSLHGNMEDKMADSIDVMMCVVFEFFDEICLNEGQLELDAACSIFKCFIKIFFEQIYITLGPSHVQFLIFKLTSYEPVNFPSYFLNALWEKFQDLTVPALLRQIAIGYMSCYIARATFLSISTVTSYLDLMVEWIHQYLEDRTDELLRADQSRHSVWYAVCQAVFNIVVFHHKTLIDMENGRSYLRRLNFERIITSKLNPLKICPWSVVELFASITNKYEIVFCYTIIEENKRVLLPTATAATPTRSNPVALENSRQLFDPYHLKRSSRYISSLYRNLSNEEILIAAIEEGEKSLAQDNDSLIPSSLESSVQSLSLT